VIKSAIASLPGKLFRPLRRKIRTAATDIRFGGRFLNGSLSTSNSHLGAYPIENTGYDVLPLLFDGRVRDKDVLVDVGCGKGRVLNWWLLHYPNHSIIGIELEESVGQQTKHRLKKYANVQICVGDIRKLFPEQGTLFYLNNPFDAAVMRDFIRQFAKVPGRRIVYHNCTCIDLFSNEPGLMIEHISFKEYGLPCAVIESR
jgi:SAM-dependent methyltransferase